MSSPQSLAEPVSADQLSDQALLLAFESTVKFDKHSQMTSGPSFPHPQSLGEPIPSDQFLSQALEPQVLLHLLSRDRV